MVLTANKENGFYIINPNCKELSCNVVCAIKDFLDTHNKRRNGNFALNLESVEEINEEFMAFLQKSGLSVFGANTDVLGYMALRNIINTVPVYTNKSDLINKKRKFVKRSFRVVK